MVFRRPNAPRNRPAPSHAAGGPVVVPAVVESAPEDSDADAAGFDPKKVADDLLGQLDDLLRSDSSIGQDDREALTGQFAAALRDEEAALAAWLDITPLARNEWLCFVAEGKLAETRVRRIERAVSQLAGGQRRPCCWPGCAHRERNGR